MDFDYQKIKDEESHQREARLSAFPVLQPKPMLQLSTATEAPSSKPKPPIKPRRNIKCRGITQGTIVGQSYNQANPTENEERKKIAPSQVLNPPGPLDAQTPSLQAHNLLWFQRTQLPRLPKPMPCWLHGFATRREAEQLLQDKQQGCFLLRLSESKVAFVLSYRGADKCRHFIIEEEYDASGRDGRYIIAGENSKHCSLEELINYYTLNPVGPFNEKLTMPCVQPNGTCEATTKLEVRNKAEKDDESIATPKCSIEHPSSMPTAADAHAAPEPAQYAVVKKALRKSHSLSEFNTVSDVVPLIQENTDEESEKNTKEPIFSSTDMCVGGDVTHAVDAPYARVNKPQRPAQPSSVGHPNASECGASAATESQSFPDAAAVAEQKYCKLEPVHTYEEALHTRADENQIDFYAVGRRGENLRNADFPANHVYSEVNIKGTRDDPVAASPPLWTGTTFITTQSSMRPIPRLAPRSALRPPNAPVRTDSSTQNFSVSALRNPHHYQSEQLPAENSVFSIYEQIPERPNNSRPPLPLLNSKR